MESGDKPLYWFLICSGYKTYRFLPLLFKHYIPSVQSDKRYSLLVSTQNGFLRYQMFDIVEVRGFYNGVPLLEFIGKEQNFLDYFGEKIDEAAFDEILRTSSSGLNIVIEKYLLSCEDYGTEGFAYTLFLPAEGFLSDNLAEAIERELCEHNIHYAYARHLGQLQRLRIVPISSDSFHRILLSVSEEKRQKLGDIKPFRLISGNDWHKKLL